MLQLLVVAGNVDHALFAVLPRLLVTDHPVQVPAWLCLVNECSALDLSFIRARGDLPAGRILKKLLDTLNAYLFHMDEIPDAPQPFNIIL